MQAWLTDLQIGTLEHLAFVNTSENGVLSDFEEGPRFKCQETLNLRSLVLVRTYGRYEIEAMISASRSTLESLEVRKKRRCTLKLPLCPKLQTINL
jgi:hypothetical protein